MVVVVVVIVIVVMVGLVFGAGHGNLVQDVNAFCDGPRKRIVEYRPPRDP